MNYTRRFMEQKIIENEMEMLGVSANQLRATRARGIYRGRQDLCMAVGTG